MTINNNMKIAVVDCETTGLDPSKHEIIEIGCVIFDDKTFEILDTVDLKVRPRHISTADPEAIKINGYTPEKWEGALRLGAAVHILMEKADDAMFCAHNVSFDYSFIRATGVLDSFDHHKVDLFSLAWAKIPHRKMPHWSLESICEYLGIKSEPKIHRAINGAMAGYEVYKKLMQRKRKKKV